MLIFYYKQTYESLTVYHLNQNKIPVVCFRYFGPIHQITSQQENPTHYYRDHKCSIKTNSILIITIKTIRIYVMSTCC